MAQTLHTSAGVYFQTLDRSIQTQLSNGGVVTLVMPAPRGRIGQNLRITASEFDSLMESSSDNNWTNVEILRLLSKQANYINFTRVGKDVLYAGTMVTTYNNLSVSRPIAVGMSTIDQIEFGSHDILAVVGRDGGEYANDYYVAYEPNYSDVDVNSFNLYVYKVGTKKPLRTFTAATLYYYTDADNRQCFIEELVNNDPLCPVMVFVNANHFKLSTDKTYGAINAVGGGPYDANSPTTPHGQLMHGSDGMEIDIYSSDDTIRNASLALVLEGWDNYKDWEIIDVGIACDGGLAHPAISSKIDEILQVRQDSIGCSNVPAQWQQYSNAVAYRHGYKKLDGMEFALSTSYGTLCTGDLWYTAPSRNRGFFVPYSVAQAYIMLECDKTFSWLAPAGLNRGGLPWAEYIRDGGYDVDARDIFNDNQINFPIHFKNPMSAFDAVGIYGWSADTLNGKGSALDDIGVQRLLSVITSSARADFLVYNFEGNDNVLRTNIKNNLERNILQPAYDGRGLEWFEVVCGTANNTNQDVANGDLFVDVYLDVTRYTKRIMLNLNISPTGQLKSVVQLIEKGQVS